MDTASSGSSSSEEEGMSGGTIVGVVAGLLVLLVLVTAAIMWARGNTTPSQCANIRIPGRGSKTTTPMYSNPGFESSDEVLQRPYSAC